jgi:hypothetical protein
MKPCVIILIIAIVVVIIAYIHKGREKYGTPLGQLAPYRKFIAECVNECNREDPNKRLLASGNWNCGKYCESMATELSRQGIPPSSIKIHNSLEHCQKQCEDPSKSKYEIQNCKSMCFGQNEVAKWCKELYCPYSLLDEGECMRQCFAVNTTNNNQLAWTWGSRG